MVDSFMLYLVSTSGSTVFGQDDSLESFTALHLTLHCTFARMKKLQKQQCEFACGYDLDGNRQIRDGAMNRVMQH